MLRAIFALGINFALLTIVTLAVSRSIFDLDFQLGVIRLHEKVAILMAIDISNGLDFLVLICYKYLLNNLSRVLFIKLEYAMNNYCII